MRPSAFLICGMVLAATSVVGIAFGLVDPSAQDAGLDLGTAGAVAAGLGWATHASTVSSGARRGALAATVLSVVVGGALLLGGPLPFEMGSGPRRVYEYETRSSTEVILIGIGVTLGAFAVPVVFAGFLGAAARWAVGAGRHRAVRLVAGALALAPLLLETAGSVIGDERQWTAICVLSLAWLVWAMRRARSRRSTTPDIGMMGPVPIDPGRG